MSIPAKTNAARIHENGDHSVIVIDSIDTPTPNSTQVLVAIEYAGINYIDTYHRNGLYPNPLPFTLGREAAGKIVQVGDKVTDFAVGDRVVFMSSGTYAQYAAVETNALNRIPDNVESLKAAAALLQGLTAHYLVCSTYAIKSGDVVLVHAAAGGTGALIVQMAKIRGGVVIGTVGSEAKVQIAKAAGCDHVINYSDADFLPEVRKLFPEGVHCVYDGVGKTTWERSLKALRRRGTLCLFGNASGPVPPINPLELAKNGSLYVTRPTLVDYVADNAEYKQRAKDLFDWISQGLVKISIGKVLPLSEAAESHRLLESRECAGKIVLQV